MPLTPITTKRFADDRGWFAEVYSERTLAGLGLETRFVQDNHSCSRHAGTIRGLHFQRPPHAQAKLIRCIRGRIFDVAVDLRRGSPTFGQWAGAELSGESGRQLFVPVGYAHGFVTLEPDTEVTYKVSDFYAPECEGGIIWNDPDLRIDWPIHGLPALLSPKDQLLPRLADFDSPFSFDGEPLSQTGLLFAE
jgi:dTDP-4-dehydrorhamnose 3,5-epimerase